MELVKKKKSKIKIIIISILSTVAIMFGSFYWYVSDYYKAAPIATEILKEASSSVEVVEEEGKKNLFKPKKSKAACVHEQVAKRIANVRFIF